MIYWCDKCKAQYVPRDFDVTCPFCNDIPKYVTDMARVRYVKENYDSLAIEEIETPQGERQCSTLNKETR